MHNYGVIKKIYLLHTITKIIKVLIFHHYTSQRLFAYFDYSEKKFIVDYSYIYFHAHNECTINADIPAISEQLRNSIKEGIEINHQEIEIELTEYAFTSAYFEENKHEAKRLNHVCNYLIYNFLRHKKEAFLQFCLNVSNDIDLDKKIASLGFEKDPKNHSFLPLEKWNEDIKDGVIRLLLAPKGIVQFYIRLIKTVKLTELQAIERIKSLEYNVASTSEKIAIIGQANALTLDLHNVDWEVLKQIDNAAYVDSKSILDVRDSILSCVDSCMDKTWIEKERKYKQDIIALQGAISICEATNEEKKQMQSLLSRRKSQYVAAKNKAAVKLIHYPTLEEEVQKLHNNKLLSKQLSLMVKNIFTYRATTSTGNDDCHGKYNYKEGVDVENLFTAIAGEAGEEAFKNHIEAIEALIALLPSLEALQALTVKEVKEVKEVLLFEEAIGEYTFDFIFGPATSSPPPDKNNCPF